MSTRAEAYNNAALIIQCLARQYIAYKKVQYISSKAWKRVFDPKIKGYFWYNKITGVSSWKLPPLLTLYTKEDHLAAIQIERIVRGFIARRRVRRIAQNKYSKYYDSKQDKFYYFNQTTNETSWTASQWLLKQNLPLPPEDQALYESMQRIKELEAKLREKEQEIKDVRQKRFEELEVEVVKDKLRSVKALKRGKNMDEWTTDELAAFFTELKMEQYCQFLYSNKVDGLLFINLAEAEWADMGITNRFHIRKLQLILTQYKARYERKREKIRRGELDLEEDEDEIGTEYSPSELSEIIRQEGMSDSESEPDQQEQDDDGYDGYEDDEDDDYVLTEEEKMELEFDKKHLLMELVAAGDDTNYPLTGDIVRVRYTAYVLTTAGLYNAENLRMITSTKTGLQRPWVEFVLGIGMIIKGIDRALPKMSIGERNKIRVTPTYAYGPTGLPPHIPPDSKMLFDLTLLGFRRRAVWIKPMIQEIGLSQRPYIDDDVDGLGGAALLDEESQKS
mmetsp:Transcript_923/g.920  ORF Transcript_923/g.920 Transcript_923/m.920 type:complete len:505 (-) Transcript_923:48-1562(-)